MMRQQVNAKIHWGARDREVLEWLLEQHSITGETAEALLREAHRAKRKSVRQKALITLVFSGFGILLSGGFLALQQLAPVVVIGYGVYVVDAIGIFSIAAFVESLRRLISGKVDGSVD